MRELEPGRPERVGRSGLKAVAGAFAALAVSSGIGSAAAASGGGIASPDAPRVTDVVCLQQCAGLRQAAVGSRVQLSGRNLDGADAVRFVSASGGRIATGPTSVDSTAVEAKVPEGAATGTLEVVAYGAGTESPADRRLEILDAAEIPPPGPFKLTSARAKPRKSFYDGIRPPRVAYLFQGPGPTDVRVEVVERTSGEVVQSWIDEAAEPSAENVTRWNGRTADGRLAPNGEYRFRIGSAGAGTVEATDDSRFGFYRFSFPIRAEHTYGDGFGAGRNHQGQDVFARCGSPLRAVRGGRVQWNKVHSSAGNYLVIDGKGTTLDFMYAHLAEPSTLVRGDRVRTGQVIGSVGDSGNASGCHLHFEAWSAPGWYEGGEALPSVTQMLKAWDAWS